MYVKGDQISTYIALFATLAVAILVGTGVMLTGDPNSRVARASVFAIVAIWSLLEAVPVAVHAIRYGLDELASTMLLARVSLFVYFGLMAVSFSDMADVPSMAFTIARMFLAIACGGAAVLLIRETWRYYQDLTVIGRFVMLSTTMLFIVAVVLLVISF